MKIFRTSAAGECLAAVEPSADAPARAPHGAPSGSIELVVGDPAHEVLGIGTSLTQASAHALSTLGDEARARVLELAFGSAGAGFSMIRTHMGSCDFSTSSYCYAPEADSELRNFSLQVDEENGHLELLRDARDVPGASFKTIASPWTAPPWMKDTGAYHAPHERRGGRLLPEHYSTFARYTARYLRAMRDRGLPIWAVTPVNEPHGNQGTWESMEMSPDEQARYVAVLGAELESQGLDAKILIYDQNRTGMAEYADRIFPDPAAGHHAWGLAVHWYDSTVRVQEELIQAVRRAHPDRPVLQTEGCIDNLYSHGEERGPGAPTPWWRDDSWFWRKEATDWGYDWLSDPMPDHPPYEAAFRYARDLVGGLAHGLSAWVDWNLVLDRRGGPNHVGNQCLAPILVDGDEVYLTPLFSILRQVSSSVRPGARVHQVLGARPAGLWVLAVRNQDGAAVVHLFNEGETVDARLSWGGSTYCIHVPEAALVSSHLSATD